MVDKNPYRKKKDEETPKKVDPNTGEEVVGAGTPPAFGKYVVNPDGSATKVTREEFERRNKEKRFDQVQKAVEIERIRRAASGEDSLAGFNTLEDFQAQQAELKQENIQSIQEAGGAEPLESEKNIVTDSQLLNREVQSPGGKILNVLTDVVGTEAAGQAIRNAFGVGLSQAQQEAIRNANPQDAEAFIMRVQEQVVQRKNRTLGRKISEAVGGIVEGLPAGSFILSQTNIQTPANQIRTIKDKVSQYESVGDKLGLAGKSDPFGTLNNIQENIENLEDLEAELQYLALESPEFQASGEAQAIAVKINTVRVNLANKRNEINARIVTGSPSPSSLELQQTILELDKAIDSTKGLNS